MSSPLEQSSLTTDWISRFDAGDIHLAVALLRRLQLVSLAEFEAGIIDGIRKVCEGTNGRVAVFPVHKDPEGRSRLPSSADKIGYILTNLERYDPHRVRVRPSVDSMRAERVRHIVLIDDLIGTGGRVVKFWHRWANETVKSWLSYHRCKLWIVAFAGHEPGIERICKTITYLAQDDIVLTMPAITASPFDDKMSRLCDRYGRRTAKSFAARGVGKLMSHVVFQHGCPNNAPAILWANGNTWRALFPNRAIPPDFQRCFSDDADPDRASEALWSVGQYRLAMNLIAADHRGDQARARLMLLTVLGLLARRIPVHRIPEFLTISTALIQRVIKRLRRAGLVNADFQPTRFGIDILERVRRGAHEEDRRISPSDEAIRFYYPMSCFGVQRKSSNEPEQNP